MQLKRGGALAQGTNNLSEAVLLQAELLSISTDDRYPPLNYPAETQARRGSGLPR
jgi:hypothetical protein